MTDVKVTVKLDNEAVYGLLTADEPQDQMDARAQRILAYQLATCPVDTGNLKKHHEIRKTADGLGRQVGAFDVDYAAPVELGHENHWSGKWVPAQPWIRPSIDAARD